MEKVAGSVTSSHDGEVVKGKVITLDRSDGQSDDLFQRGIIIAISYIGSGVRQLPGIEKDILNICSYFQKIGVTEIILMTDVESEAVKILPVTRLRPTYNNVYNELIQEMQQDRSILLYFSGHGSITPDYNPVMFEEYLKQVVNIQLDLPEIRYNSRFKTRLNLEKINIEDPGLLCLIENQSSKGLNTSPNGLSFIFQRYMGMLFKTDRNLHHEKKQKFAWKVEHNFEIETNWDETLILLDDYSYEKGETYIPAVIQMRDDTLNNIFATAVPKKKILGIIDSCHSAGIFNLDYIYHEKEAYSEADTCKDLSDRVSTKQDIFMMSGCRSNQTSIATTKGSALTNTLLNFFTTHEYRDECQSKITYQQLHQYLLETMKQKGLTQRPSFSSSRENTYYEPIYRRFFLPVTITEKEEEYTLDQIPLHTIYRTNGTTLLDLLNE